VPKNSKLDKNLFLLLSIFMGVVIIISNYLVQFPINKYNLQEILTYGAFSYPITFLITDLANRRFGKEKARKLVYIGFTVGILLTLFVSTNFEDIISIRIAIGSGVAFITAQLVDIEIFQRLRNNAWFVAPITSSIFGSIIDTFLFFSISFLGTGVPWVTLAFGDLFVKLLMALLMLVPFRLLMIKIRDLNSKQLSKNITDISEEFRDRYS
jgi:queuosine precursor transporter|tara:strand:+ start:4083 stop:4715 length:633 start_codon:yes stop_codon:yes gene_type:complete